MKEITLFSWNVNGLRAVCRKGLLAWVRRTGPDILCLQETKARKAQLPEDVRSLDGYYSYFSESRIKKGYSGVATYSRFSPLSMKNGMGIRKFDDEGRFLETDFGEFMLFNVYFPNGGRANKRVPYKMSFCDAFLEYTDKHRKKGRKIIICGDVNTAHKEIDLARPRENEKNTGFLPRERAFLDELARRGYADAFREFNDRPGQYTWWDMKTGARERNVGWRIDYFFVSGNLKKRLKSAKIHSRVKGSDHCPVSISLEVKNNFK